MAVVATVVVAFLQLQNGFDNLFLLAAVSRVTRQQKSFFSYFYLAINLGSCVALGFLL